jgi:hypothetical protein
MRQNYNKTHQNKRKRVFSYNVLRGRQILRRLRSAKRRMRPLRRKEVKPQHATRVACLFFVGGFILPNPSATPSLRLPNFLADKLR